MHRAPPEALAPFGLVTSFRGDQRRTLHGIGSPSDNVFTAIRIRGMFEQIKIRVACKASEGTDLVSATSQQAMFRFEQLPGTLVGFWPPAFARTINIPGYHLHLLSDDHAHGGHGLDLQGSELMVELNSGVKPVAQRSKSDEEGRKRWVS